MKCRITFKRTQYTSIVIDGFPDTESAKIQAQATPELIGLNVDAHWVTGGPPVVDSVEEITDPAVGV